MNKTKYNQLREEIIKANEDILALKFGCKVSIPELKNNIAVIVHKEKCEKTGKEFVNVVFPYDWNTDTYFVEDIEIIGRDITLEDCLIVIPEPVKIVLMPDSVIIKDKIIWKLNTPLHQQEQETIDLLHDLICKE